jgi:hypothetical protein
METESHPPDKALEATAGAVVRMRRLLASFLGLTIILAALFFGSTLRMAARPTNEAQLLMMATGLLLFPLSVAVPAFLPRTRSSLRTLRWVGPLLVPLLFVSAAWIGHLLRARLFYRDLPELERVVHLVATGSIAVHDGRVALPAELSDLARVVFAQREPDGTLQVTFVVGGGFPVKHLAYLYRSDGRFPPELTRDWPKRRDRQQNWVEVSD